MTIRILRTVVGRAPRLAMLVLPVAVTLALPHELRAQDASEVQRQFEAGLYQQVVDSVGPEVNPDVLYLAALSAQKLAAPDRATSLLQRLAGRPAEDAWHFVGLSARQLLEGQDDAALASAHRAVAIAEGLAYAQYQLGLVMAKGQDWGTAAAAFDRAATLSPSLAYAYYYGGLMHYRAKRPDLMAVRFERFLKLAPEAPERPEVLQIMRTVRGR